VSRFTDGALIPYIFLEKINHVKVCKSTEQMHIQIKIVSI